MRAHCNEKKAGTVNRTSSSWLCAKTEKEVNKVQQNFRIFFFFFTFVESTKLYK